MCTESTLEFPPGKRLSKMPTKNVIKLRFALASPVEMPRSADDDVIAALDELHGKPWSVVEDVLKAILGTKCSKGRRRGILATLMEYDTEKWNWFWDKVDAKGKVLGYRDYYDYISTAFPSPAPFPTADSPWYPSPWFH